MGGRETAGRCMMETYHSTDQDAGALWGASGGRIFFGQVSCVYGTCKKVKKTQRCPTNLLFLRLMLSRLLWRACASVQCLSTRSNPMHMICACLSKSCLPI